MKRLNLLIVSLMLIIAGLCLPTNTYAIVSQHMADSIVANITATTPADSIRQLYICITNISTVLQK